MKKRRNKKRFQYKKDFIKTIERRTMRKVMLLSKQEVSNMIMDISPLSVKDRLFVESEDLHNSCLNRNPSIREIHLEESYFSNAIFLLNLIHESDSNAVRDGFIYPALFSFRHYLELTMKDTLNMMTGKGKVSGVVTNKVHNLSDIWTEFKKIVPDDQEIKIIEELIEELTLADPCSFNFRYTYDLKGNKISLYIKREDKKLDLEEQKPDNLNPETFPLLIDNCNLKTVMLKIYNYFEGINWSVSNSQ